MSKPEIPESIITPTAERMVPFAFKAPPELVERFERYHAELVELVREKAPMVDVTKGDAARYVFERGLDAIAVDNGRDPRDEQISDLLEQIDVLERRIQEATDAEET